MDRALWEHWATKHTQEHWLSWPDTSRDTSSCSAIGRTEVNVHPSIDKLPEERSSLLEPQLNIKSDHLTCMTT